MQLLPLNVGNIEIIVKKFRQVGGDEHPHLEVQVHGLVPLLGEDIEETISVSLEHNRTSLSLISQPGLSLITKLRVSKKVVWPNLDN
jgi:hypothetical protein